MISQRLCSLESQVGTVLLVRTRALRLTSVGQLQPKHTKMRPLIRADLERDLHKLASSRSGGLREEARKFIVSC